LTQFDRNEEFLLRIFGAGMFFDLVDVGLQAELVVEAARKAAKTRQVVRIGQFDGMTEVTNAIGNASFYVFTCRLSPEVLDLMWRNNLEPSNITWNYILPTNTRDSYENDLLSHEYIGQGRIQIIEHGNKETLLFLNKLMSTWTNIEISEIDRLI
jgi:hypothetical protein